MVMERRQRGCQRRRQVAMGVYVAKPILLAKMGGHDLPLYSTEMVVAGHSQPHQPHPTFESRRRYNGQFIEGQHATTRKRQRKLKRQMRYNKTNITCSAESNHRYPPIPPTTVSVTDSLAPHHSHCLLVTFDLDLSSLPDLLRSR